jgi:hypothetical protein
VWLVFLQLLNGGKGISAKGKRLLAQFFEGFLTSLCLIQHPRI